MWNSLVSNADAILSATLARCVETAWRYPMVGALFLAVFCVLTVLLWIEVLKDSAEAAEAFDDARPIRSRR